MKTRFLVIVALIFAVGNAQAAKRKNTSYNVGQIYLGGHLGFALPTAIAEDNDNWAFNDAAKTGFVIYADIMRQMNQSVGLGGEIGFVNFPFNDQKFYEANSQYGSYDATFRGLDFDLTGRIFLGSGAVRPFIGVFGGGEVVMNSATFSPRTGYQQFTSADYKQTNLSAHFGFMAGAYFKMGRRTLLSVQGRISFVPTVKSETLYAKSDDYPEEDGFPIRPVAHNSQTSIGITLGLHVGKDSKNQR